MLLSWNMNCYWTAACNRLGRLRTLICKPFKRPSGAFYRTELDRRLRESGSDTVVFASCNFPNCPRTSI